MVDSVPKQAALDPATTESAMRSGNRFDGLQWCRDWVLPRRRIESIRLREQNIPIPIVCILKQTVDDTADRQAPSLSKCPQLP